MSSKQKSKEAMARRAALRATIENNKVQRAIAIRAEARDAIIGKIVAMSSRTLNKQERRTLSTLIKAARALRSNNA